MKKYYLPILSALSVCACMVFGVQSATAATKPHITIRVFASDAVEQPIREIGYLFETEHPNVRMHYEFAESGIFYIAIVQGVPPDIFVSAGNKYQNKLSAESSINLANTVGYDYLALAAPCHNPGEDAPFARPTESNVVQLMMDKNVPLTMANPELSPAGSHTIQMLSNINRSYPGAKDSILMRSEKVSDPAQVVSKLQRGKAQMGIVYASQLVGQKRVGACIEGAVIPKKFNTRVEFTISVLKKSPFHYVGTERKKLDHEFRDLVLSTAGQKILKEWGIIPAKEGGSFFARVF